MHAAQLVCKVCSKELTEDEVLDLDHPTSDGWRCADHKELWAYGLGQPNPGVYEIVRYHPNNSGGDYRKRSDVDPLITNLKQHVEKVEAELKKIKDWIIELTILSLPKK